MIIMDKSMILNILIIEIVINKKNKKKNYLLQNHFFSEIRKHNFEEFISF